MLKRFILWDFPRASWQYDVIVAVILAFIFLTPRVIRTDDDAKRLSDPMKQRADQVRPQNYGSEPYNACFNSSSFTR